MTAFSATMERTTRAPAATRTPGIAFTARKKDGSFNAESEDPEKPARAVRFFVNLPGDFNTWNALAAVSAADRLGAPVSAMREALANVHIKGRDDMVYRGRFQVCVDFAHNGESAFHHLSAVRAFRPKRVIAVFGWPMLRIKWFIPGTIVWKIAPHKMMRI